MGLWWQGVFVFERHVLTREGHRNDMQFPYLRLEVFADHQEVCVPRKLLQHLI